MRPHGITIFCDNIQEVSSWYLNTFKSTLVTEEERLIQHKLGDFLLTFHPQDSKSSGSSGQQVLYWEIDGLRETLDSLIFQGATMFRAPITDARLRGIALERENSVLRLLRR